MSERESQPLSSHDDPAPAGQATAVRLMDHSYDGIQEYDNPLPGWWKGIFLLSIVFAGGYCVFYHGGGPGQSSAAAYKDEMKEAAALLAKQAVANVDDQTLARMANNQALLDGIRPLFLKECVQCHGDGGEGKIGPNLTDDHQMHGKTRVDLYNTINNGVPEKGMIAWGKKLPPTEVVNLAAFVSSLRGTNAAGGKAPEGDKLGPWK